MKDSTIRKLKFIIQRDFIEEAKASENVFSEPYKTANWARVYDYQYMADDSSIILGMINAEYTAAQ